MKLIKKVGVLATVIMSVLFAPSNLAETRGLK